MGNYHKLNRWLLVILWAVTIVGVLPTGPAQAQILSPSIKVAPVWHPAQQLTTIDANGDRIWNTGDDFRYIEADIMVTTTVEFWAAEISCTVDRTILEGYANYDTGPTYGSHDNQAMITWGGVWGTAGTTFVQYIKTYASAYGSSPFDPATGKITFTASKMAMADPIGQNNISTTEKLAVLRFRVKPQTGTVNKTAALTCTSSFLDRNGKQVVAASYQAPTAAKITSGYSITGKASYQGRTTKTGIGVSCDSATQPYPDVVTNTEGKFTVLNIRETGEFVCTFFGNMTNKTPTREDDLYLPTNVKFTVDESGSMYILPVELKGGDLVMDETINNVDIDIITTNWLMNAAGDINGDLKTDKADLAIATGNSGRTWTATASIAQSSHILYSLATAYGTLYNNRIWLGDYRSGAVTQVIATTGNSQFYWPALAPNGTKIAYTRSDGNANYALRKYELYLYDTATNGQTALVTRAMMSNSYDAFAPSWSPDGTRIAFVRSKYTYTGGVAARDWYTNEGQLTVVDASGRNYRALDWIASIYPPAWLTNDLIAFGCYDTTSSPRICYFDLAAGSGGYYANFPTGSDMPVAVNGDLFYRWTDVSLSVPRPSYLRFAELNWTASPPTATAYAPLTLTLAGINVARPTYYNTDVVVVSGSSVYKLGSAVLDYYDVSWSGNNLIYNVFDGNKWTNAWFDATAYNTNGYYPRWATTAATDDHMVDSQMWATPWVDRNPETATELHGLRNTVDWVP